MSKGLYLFRSDLRLSDNPLLSRACKECDQLALLVVLHPSQWQDPRSHDVRQSFRRQHFLKESVEDLRASIQTKGLQLIVRFGDELDVLKEIQRSYAMDKLYLEQLPGTEEEGVFDQLFQWCRQAGIQCHTLWQRTLHGIEQLPFKLDRLPHIFTVFRQQVEKNWFVRPIEEVLIWPSAWEAQSDEWPIHLNAPVEIDARAVMSFTGGSHAAKERVQYYCSEPERLGRYKQTRNGMVGADYSSKFSPWLSVGSISPVEIYHAIRDYEEQHGANESSYWLIFELLWRDFFQYTLWVHGDKVFQYDGFGKGEGPLMVSNETALSNWCEGRTGNDFVDGCMRELVATGFMSNRGRQNVASYLVHDLQQDWRRGADFFEYHLLDYEVASNWCNWAYIAGVGNDPRAGRRFNIDKQASDYDPNHTFRNHWKDGSK